MQGVTDHILRVAARVPRLWHWLFEAYVRWLAIAGARGVTEPVKFALNELFLRRCIRRYTLRRSGRTVFIRHPMGDALAVHEVINRRMYLPPPSVELLLQDIEAPRIVDLGAHIGTASLLLLERYPDARIVAFEPQPETASLLRRNIEVNGLGGQCEVREAAAGVTPGTAVMEGSGFLAHFERADTAEAVDLLPPLAKYQENGARADVEIVDVLPLLEGADLVKMDIEGAEWPILQDPRFASTGISALVLEYHPQGAPQDDTYAALTEVLGGAGFTVDQPVEEYGSATGVVWARRS
jgi:FkbM family methyltransferase